MLFQSELLCREEKDRVKKLRQKTGQETRSKGRAKERTKDKGQRQTEGKKTRQKGGVKGKGKDWRRKLKKMHVIKN